MTLILIIVTKIKIEYRTIIVRIRRSWTALQKLAVNIIIKTPENPPSKIISKNSKIQKKKKMTNN